MSWSAYVNRWHDERYVVHLARSDGSPACGASYYMMTGAYEGIHDNRKCRTCKKIEKRSK